VRESRCLESVCQSMICENVCASYSLLTFPVIAKAHPGLSQANGVFPSADTIELLEFGLFDALRRDQSGCVLPSGTGLASGGRSVKAYLAGKVKFDGLDADVLWSRRHYCVCSSRLRFGGCDQWVVVYYS